MYCDRSHNCLNLFNTTTVVATPAETDYLAFMYSAYNSPLPSMQQIAGFYHTDIAVKYVQFVAGPGDSAITIQRMESLAWVVVDNVVSSVPIVAKKLPLPPGLGWELQRTRAGPLVQTVDSCERLEAAIRYPKQHALRAGRLEVWMMLGNLTLDPANPSCWEDQDIAFTTQLYGQQLHSTTADSATAHRMQQAVLLGTAVPAPASGNASSAPEPAQVAPLTDQFALNFQHVRSALRLPPNADEGFLKIQNVTLTQLPQGPNTGAAAGSMLAVNGDEASPPDVWTILLWSIGRGTQKEFLYLNNAQLMLPQPEFDFLLNRAKTARSFALQLTGGASIVVTGAAAGDAAVRLQTVHGPGMAGDNVVLLPDPGAAAAMPGYAWPFVDGASAAAPARECQRTTEGAAIGASIGGAALLAWIAGIAWRARRRRRLQQQAAEDGKAYSLPEFVKPAVGKGGGLGGLKGAASKGNATTASTAADCQVDADQVSSQVSGPYTAATPDVEYAPSASIITLTQIGSTGSCPSIDEHSPYNGALASPIAAAPGVKPSLEHADSISTGIARWRSAIHNLSLHLMERSMSSSTTGTPAGYESSSTGQPTTPAQAATKPRRFSTRPEPARRYSTDSIRRLSTDSNRRQSADGAGAGCLQLQQMIGQGSFGGVYQGTWHGKRVAVKIMQLPANALLEQQEEASTAADSANCQLGQPLKGPQSKQRRTPHMAIMETVVSSTMSHPNVVQVYTYMLNLLTVDNQGAGTASQQATQSSGLCRAPPLITGWEMRLVMEYCDQGSLREALCHKSLQSANPDQPYLPCSVTLSLAHDVAAAMLHLHSGDVIHGDLKAANVLLTTDNDDPGNVWAATVGYKVTAKVADFGLALPMDPDNTHMSMTARGTPTHMSPELFISGHVSKASDVYAYGILLYEIITGQRAYAGVPIPLLPHEVALQGLRPTWPPGLPNAYKPLQRLAEACWAQNPHDRPTFADVFQYLESCQKGSPATHLLPKPGGELRSQQHQQHSQDTSPKQRTAAAAVNWQLQELRQTAEQQLQFVKQSSSAESSPAPPVALAVVDLGEIVWSGVEHDAGMPGSTAQQYP